MKDFRAQAAALYAEMVARRRDLHQHPELAFQETRTANMVAQALQELGLEVQTGIGKTGVIGVLEGAAAGPTVLVRCDMDALPIEEENMVGYRSQNAGVMHACGHDAHTTMALAAAKLLHAQRDQMKGRVKFIFQPAEEIGAGAQAMIDDGALNDPTPEISVGLHVWPYLPVGEVVVSGGALMAGAAHFTIELTGKNGHAAAPHETIDPVIAAAQIVIALHSITSRNLNPLDPAVLSVTQIHTGTAFNVIPTHATLTGTFRTFTQSARDTIVRRMEEITNGIAAGMGCQVVMTIKEPVPPVINDESVAARLRAGLAQTAPDLKVYDRYQSMVSEDMALFLQRAPGVFMLLGCAGDYPLHHPRFDLDENAMPLGAALLAATVSDYIFSG